MTGTTKSAARFAPCCEIRLLGGGRLFHQEFNFRVEIRYDDGKLERQKSSFLPNSRTPFSRLFAGFFSPPKVTPLEGLLCASFSQSWSLTRFGLKFRFPRNRIRRGLAHFFDLTWLSNPDAYRYFGGHLLPPLSLHGGSALPITLPLLALGHVMAFTLITRRATHIMAFRLLA